MRDKISNGTGGSPIFSNVCFRHNICKEIAMVCYFVTPCMMMLFSTSWKYDGRITQLSSLKLSNLSNRILKGFIAGDFSSFLSYFPHAAWFHSL